MATEITHKATDRTVDLTGLPEPVVEQVHALVRRARQKQAEEAEVSARGGGDNRPSANGHVMKPGGPDSAGAPDQVGQELRAGEFPQFISDPRPTPQEFRRVLDEMASMGTGRALPTDFSRADVYDDHD